MGAKKSKVNVQQGGLESTFSGGLDPKKVFPPSGNFEWLSKEYKELVEDYYSSLCMPSNILMILLHLSNVDMIFLSKLTSNTDNIIL